MTFSPCGKDIPNANAKTADFEFEALRQAYYYPRAIVDEFLPFIKGNLIEVGAGIGQLTSILAAKFGNNNVLAVEPDIEFAKDFKKYCPNVRLIEGTVCDIPQDTPCNTIVSVNVMEHIRDQVKELSNYKMLLEPTAGHLCVLAPARPEIYAPIDQDFGHFRRYTKESINSALKESGFNPKSIYYFNSPGYFIWGLNFKILKSRSFNPFLVRLFDRTLFRLAHSLERNIARPPLGQSIIAIAQA